MTLMTGTGHPSAGYPKQWTLRRWIHAIVVTLAIQVAIIIVVGRRTVPANSRPTFPTKVRLVADPASESLRDLMTVTDPAHFALPSLHGFSGAAWLRYPLLQHTPVERTEVPHWLELNPDRLAYQFVDFVSTNKLPAVLMVDVPLPSAARYEANYPPETVAPMSQIRLEGGLVRRTLLHRSELPSWPHTEILSNTTVRAIVDAAGWVFSATLVARSGLPAADEYATRLVENARFAPLPSTRDQSDEFTWGTFVFSWHTRPLVATNAPGLIP
jgi:hypothetical protein